MDRGSVAYYLNSRGTPNRTGFILLVLIVTASHIESLPLSVPQMGEPSGTEADRPLGLDDR